MWNQTDATHRVSLTEVLVCLCYMYLSDNLHPSIMLQQLHLFMTLWILNWYPSYLTAYRYIPIYRLLLLGTSI